MKTVSVIIPIYNSRNTIEKTIESVLSQDYQSLEIIVVDDYSSDSAVNFISQKFGNQVSIIKHADNRGGSAARNTGVLASTGEFIAFLDADDEWYPTKISQQVKVIETSPFEDCVATYCRAHNDIGRVLGSGHRGKFIKEMFCGEANIVSSSGLLVTRNAWNKVKGFDVTFRRHQDIEFVIRLMGEGSIECIAVPLFKKIPTGAPTLNNTRQGVQKFWVKFKTDIDALPYLDGRLVYARGYLRFFELAFREQKYFKSLCYLFRSLYLTPRAFLQKKQRYLPKSKAFQM